MVKIKKIIDKFLEFIFREKKSPHYEIRKYFRRKIKHPNQSNVIAIATFNHQHAKYLYDIIMCGYMPYIRKTISPLRIELINGDTIYFITNDPYKVKGTRFRKLLIYSKLLHDDIDFVRQAVIPCAYNCSKKDVFIIPDRQEEKIIDILRQL
jgi:hypothetical protein